MEYTIQKLAALAGITTRTLRYYDQIRLLKPKKINSSGYRIYGEKEVDRLQQILFFRELGMELKEIAAIMNNSDYTTMEALQSHLKKLKERKKQISLLIKTVTKTIEKEEGKITMTDKEKFEGLKKKELEQNEALYGTEIRASYGTETVEESYKKYQNLSKEEYDEMKNEEEEIKFLLEQAVKKQESPKGEVGKKIAELHKKWLSHTWASYSKEAHIGVAQMYVSDEQFTKYYDKNVEGCANFLKEAIEYYLSK